MMLGCFQDQESLARYLFIIPAQVLSLSSKLRRQGRDLRLLHVGKEGLAE